MYTRAWIAVSALFVSLSAQAVGTVQLQSFTYDPFAGGPGPSVLAPDQIYDPLHFITKDEVSIAPPSIGTYAGGGQMQGLLNGASFQAFCAEIDNPISFGPVYTDYVPLSGVVGFGATKANDLAKLMSWAAAGHHSNAAESAALQAAVWEIVHETGPSYSFSSGNVRSSSANAVTSIALGAIDWAAISSTNVTYSVSKLDGSAQDLLIFVPIPETGTLAMMSLGALCFGAVVRRRRRN